MSGYNAGYIPGGSGVTSFLKLADSLETTFTGQDGKIVSVNESSGGLEFVTASAASLTNQSNVLYVSKAGDDLNNGQTIEGSFLTIQAAVDAASAGTVVQVLDSGTYDETVTLTAGVHLDAGNAKIATTAGGCLVLDGGSRVFLGDATPASGSNAVVRSASASSSSTTVVTVQTITCTGAGLGIVNADTDATLIARANAITVATGAGIGNPAAANGTTVVDVGSITVTGNSGYGVYNHTGYLCGRIGQIVESGTPTNTVGFGQQGAGATTTIVLGKVTTDIAHACGASTTLNLYAGDVTGTELSTGTSNIFTNGAARILRETGGPTALSMAGVTDGQYLKRSGTTITSSAIPAPEGTAVLSTGETGGVKFLREDGDDSSSWQPIPAQEGSAILSTGEVGGTKYLREDGDGTCSWQSVSAGSVEGTAVLSTGETGAVKFLREDGDDSCSWIQPTLQGAYAGSASVTLTAATPIIFGYPSVGTTMNTPALKLQNTTAAVTGGSGAQYAPSLVMEGRQWSGSASVESSIHILNGNADGASAGAWITFGRTYNGGAVSELGDFGRAGYAFRVVGGPSQFYNSYVEFGTNACRIDDASDYSTDWSTVDTFKAPASNRAMLFLHQNRTDGSGTEAFGIYWDTNSATGPAGYPLTVGWVDNSNVTQIVLGVTGHGISLPQAMNASSPPTAIAVGEIAYFSNGDAGAKCLGFWDGSNWLRISLGAAVSAT